MAQGEIKLGEQLKQAKEEGRQEGTMIHGCVCMYARCIYVRMCRCKLRSMHGWMLKRGNNVQTYCVHLACTYIIHAYIIHAYHTYTHTRVP